MTIDRSEATREGGLDLLAAQVQAARSLLEGLAPRLGPVRVGITAYPNMPPLPGALGGTGARRVVALSDDPDGAKWMGEIITAFDRIVVPRKKASGADRGRS